MKLCKIWGGRTSKVRLNFTSPLNKDKGKGVM